jgi:Putative porin
MQFFRFYILSLLLLMLTHFVNAQNSQKLDSAFIIKAFKINNETLLADTSVLDTTIKATYYSNSVFQHSFSNTFLGNTGSASQSNIFHQREMEYPFLFAFPYQMYLHDPYKIQHFKTRKPFTDLSYLTSGNKDNSEQVIQVVHTQNVNQYINVGLLYDLIASRGQYENQDISANRFSLFSSYKKDNYSIYGSTSFNSVKTQENGGLFDINEFLSNQSTDLIYTTSLSDASSRLKYYSYFVTQKLDLFKSASDSLHNHRENAFSLQHTINYNRFVKIYSDEISSSDTINFYDNNYYLINTAQDSAFYHNLSNRIDLSIVFGKGSQELRTWIKHEYKQYSFQYPEPIIYSPDGITLVDTVLYGIQRKAYNDLSIGGEYRGIIGNWDYKALGFLYLTGYQAGDVMAKASFTRYLSQKQRKLVISGNLSSLKPDYFLNHYGSSHFIWDNAFRNTDKIGAEMLYVGKKQFNVEAALNYYTGYIYFDNTAMPAQDENQIFVASLLIDKTFIWGHFQHNHKILLQEPSSDIIHVPWLAYSNTTLYENQLFKGVLKFELGFSFYYFNQYYADEYMPATGIFYRQNEGMIGEYPFLDGFLNWKIKRTRFSLKYTNALGGIVSNDYFMAYRYPIFNSTLRFGLSWTFYD